MADPWEEQGTQPPLCQNFIFMEVFGKNSNSRLKLPLGIGAPSLRNPGPVTVFANQSECEISYLFDIKIFFTKSDIYHNLSLYLQSSHISGLTKFHDISMIFLGFSKKFHIYFLNILNVASNYFWINVYIKKFI